MNTLPDDDRTVIRPVASPSAMGSASDPHALPQGTILGEFELLEKLGEGGFSIVYLAHDHSLDRRVALKEYMPSSLADRRADAQITPRSERHRETFEMGLKSFINEAKLLAHFDHSSLVKVHRFWASHGTAFMVMPLYKGPTLREAVRASGKAPDEAWLMRLLGPLTEALCVIHADQCFHRDIAPDNIILLEGSGRPLLLDFGAARRVIGDMTQALTVILKPGFAPVEQYAESPDMKQGAWTDVYALAATVYWCITAQTPPPAVGRLLGDTYRPLSEVAKGRYSDRFLRAVDRALAVRPEDRTRSIEAFRVDLGLQAGRARGDAVRADAAVPPEGGAPRGRHWRWMVPAGLVAVLGGAGVWWAQAGRVDALRRQASSTTPTPVAPESALPKEEAPAPVTAAPAAAPPEPVALPATKAPPPVVAPTPATPTPSTPPPSVRAEAPAERTRAAPAAPGAKPTRSTDTRSAECASILQMVSLGNATSEMLERLKTLNCR